MQFGEPEAVVESYLFAVAEERQAWHALALAHAAQGDIEYVEQAHARWSAASARVGEVGKQLTVFLLR
jgi:predicted Zn-dependent protease